MSSNNIEEYLNKLNKEQKEAAILKKESALILAAAGSGKTSTLTSRIAYLIECENVYPSNIMAVTFTNKAAKEMKNRLFRMGIDTKNVWIGTFHGICNRILRDHGKEIGIDKNFYIMDQSEQTSFIKRVFKSNGYDVKSLNIDDIQNMINDFKENGLRAKDLKENTVQKKYYSLYEDGCKKDNCVDFGELLLGCYELFEKNEHILDYFNDKFHYILVDEFQDTSELQYKWLKLLSKKHKNIFAVGDDDQSIYSFRGAKPENLNLFIRDFNAKIIKIEKNYRSDANILEAANAVIKNNTNRQGKNLVPTKKAENLIQLFEAFNDEQESAFIASQIKNYRRKGVPYKDMAILYRTNGQSRSLEKALNSMNVPYVVYGGFRFFDRQEIKHAMAYLRLAHNPNDNLAFLRVANIPVRSIGNASLEKLEKLAKENNSSLFEAVKNLDDKTYKKIKPFTDIIELLQKRCHGKKLSEMVKTVIVDSGLEKMYEEDKKEGPERLDNLYELISAAEVFMAENKFSQSNIEDFLAFSVLDSDPESKKRDENADVVKLMTVHASKGLEFKVVFLAGMEENIFPHVNSIGDKTSIEEERRLMYVAITRAKEHLFISLAEERLLHGNWNHFIKSRFLREIPKNLIYKIN